MIAGRRASYASSRPTRESARRNEKRAFDLKMDSGAEDLVLSPSMLTRRPPWVLLLAAVVLAGALDMHLVDESRELAGAGTDGTYSLSAKHPNAPAHCEPFEPSQEPDCPCCLHQLRVAGAYLRLVSRLPTPMLGSFRAPNAAPLLREHRAAPDVARGPPAL